MTIAGSNEWVIGAQRIEQVMQLISQGAESIQTTIKAKPEVVAELIQTISRNGNTMN